MTYFEVMEAYLNIFKTFLGLYLFSKSMRTIRRCVQSPDIQGTSKYKRLNNL